VKNEACSVAAKVVLKKRLFKHRSGPQIQLIGSVFLHTLPTWEPCGLWQVHNPVLDEALYHAMVLESS
jgi:hypothetical protein